MMMTVLRKSTVRPWPSVSRPSSMICSSTLSTSGCAFSISSNRIDAVRPAPHRFGETAALVVADVAGRRADQARHRVPLAGTPTCRCGPSRPRRRTCTRPAPCASSVLPTPVGPRKMKLPIGRFGSLSPLRARRMASDSAVDGRVLADDLARAAPPPCAAASRPRPPACGCTGMPVIEPISAAMSCAVTVIVAAAVAVLCSHSRLLGVVLGLDLAGPPSADAAAVLVVLACRRRLDLRVRARRGAS